MRAYLPVTPQGLQAFLTSGTFHTDRAFVVDQSSLESNGATADDQEELEFEVSWHSAEKSREIQGGSAPFGFVLAVDLEPGQTRVAQADEVALLSDISWSQVQSLLVSESEEPELSWFAPQEVATYLPQWLA